MARKRAESKPFKSGPQISVQDDGKKQAKMPRNWKLYDEMVKHPTIRLAMDVTLAMAMREPWTIEGGDKEITAFMQQQLDTWKEQILTSALLGFFKRGWRAFETRYGFVDHDVLGLRQTLDGVRALRNENTFRVIDPDDGTFLGVLTKKVGGIGSDEETLIDAEHVLFVNQDEEGFGEYGEPTMETALMPWQKWTKCDDGAERYDAKVAGGVLIVKYPVGSTKYAQNGDALTDNADIAEDILKRLQASGTCKIPVRVVDEVTGEILKEVNDPWKLEHVAASGGGLQPNFVSRGKYLDAMMMRAFGLPERSATEGTLGTKAEAEAHADIAMMVNHQRHKRVANAVNQDIVQPLNENNWGDAGETQLVLGELDRDSRELFSSIFIAMLSDPVHADAVAARVDVEAMLRKLDIPSLEATSGSFGSEVSADATIMGPIGAVG